MGRLAPLDQRSQEMLDRVLVKDINDLTETDKAVLRARSQYLGRHSTDKFRSVLEEKSNFKEQPLGQATEQATEPEVPSFDQNSDEDGEDEV